MAPVNIKVSLDACNPGHAAVPFDPRCAPTSRRLPRCSSFVYSSPAHRIDRGKFCCPIVLILPRQFQGSRIIRCPSIRFQGASREGLVRPRQLTTHSLPSRSLCQFFATLGVGGWRLWRPAHDKRIVPVSEPMQLDLICNGMPTSPHWQLCLNPQVELRRLGAICPLLSSRGHTYLLCAMQRCRMQRCRGGCAQGFPFQCSILLLPCHGKISVLSTRRQESLGCSFAKRKTTGRFS